MFTQTQFQFLFAYHWHTGRRLMDCAAKLNETDYKHNPGYGHGSIHDLLFHILRTDQGWRQRLETNQQLPPIQPQDFPDLLSLEAGFAEEKKAWQALLDGLSAEAIEGSLELTNRRGEVGMLPRWKILQHVVLHGMQHLTEIAQLLTGVGQSPGDIDFIFFKE